MSPPLSQATIDPISDVVVVRIFPRTTETDDDASTTLLPRVKELNDAAAAALLASAPLPHDAKSVGDECPKCGVQVRVGSNACASCGLAAARMATFTIERDQAVPEPIVRAWERVMARWEDPEGHDALFHMIAERGEYGWAAGRYRAQARERAGDRIARHRMERIRRAIEATLVVSATARDKSGPSPYKNTMALLAVLLVVLVVGLFYVFVESRSASSGTPPVGSARM